MLLPWNLHFVKGSLPIFMLDRIFLCCTSCTGLIHFLLVRTLFQISPTNKSLDGCYQGNISLSRKILIGQQPSKRLVKLMQQVKIAHSFLQSVSNQFRVIIFSLPMSFYKWLSKNFLKPTSIKGEIDRFNQSLFIESFWPTLKCH